jgi:hypothetical protein
MSAEPLELEFDPLDWPTGFDEAMAHAIRLGLMTPAGAATNRCQCPTCGEVFSTEGNFDRHLTRGRLAEGFAGEWCQDPAAAGLVRTGVAWHQPGPELSQGAHSDLWGERRAGVDTTEVSQSQGAVS